MTSDMFRLQCSLITSCPNLGRILEFVSVTRRVGIERQDLITLTEHVDSPPVFVGLVLFNL